jgi:hypothetical protein
MPDHPAHWHRLAPGVYDDNRGGLHIVAGELLDAAGYQDTPENRQTLIDAVRDVFAAHLDCGHIEVVD